MLRSGSCVPTFFKYPSHLGKSLASVIGSSSPLSSLRSALQIRCSEIQYGHRVNRLQMSLNVRYTTRHARNAAKRPNNTNATAAAAIRRHVAAANGIPTTDMHIHLRTMARLCHACTKPIHAAVGIVTIFSIGRASLKLSRISRRQVSSRCDMQPCC